MDSTRQILNDLSDLMQNGIKDIRTLINDYNIYIYIILHSWTFFNFFQIIKHQEFKIIIKYL